MTSRKRAAHPPRPASPSIQVFNRQRKHAIDAGHLKRVALFVADRLRLGAREVCVVLISDRAIRRLNSNYRGLDKATDVLSFGESGVDAYLGDIFISAETAAVNAHREGHSLLRETSLLVLHGILHLAGYDHEKDQGHMFRLERRLRRSELFSV